MALRKTIDRDVIVTVANRMIEHLSESGTKADADKREAIIAVTDSILMEGGGYAGYRYLNLPREIENKGWTRKVYDETRVAFY